MDELLVALRSLLELGFPAVVLLQLLIVWRAYTHAVNRHIDDLHRLLDIISTQCTRRRQLPPDSA